MACLLRECAAEIMKDANLQSWYKLIDKLISMQGNNPNLLGKINTCMELFWSINFWKKNQLQTRNSYHEIHCTCSKYLVTAPTSNCSETEKWTLISDDIIIIILLYVYFLQLLQIFKSSLWKYYLLDVIPKYEKLFLWDLQRSRIHVLKFVDKKLPWGMWTMFSPVEGYVY